jgi:hypothetical protein
MLAPFDGKPDHRLMWQKLVGLDWISAVLTLGFVTCLGVGLQWGGITKPWNDAGVIAVSPLRAHFRLTSPSCAGAFRPP